MKSIYVNQVTAKSADGHLVEVEFARSSKLDQDGKFDWDSVASLITSVGHLERMIEYLSEYLNVLRAARYRFDVEGISFAKTLVDDEYNAKTEPKRRKIWDELEENFLKNPVVKDPNTVRRDE